MTPQAPLEYAGSARIFRWYGLDDDAPFRCRCGWQGNFREMDHGWFEEVLDGSCPVCDTMLAIRSFATEAEVREAAANGNAQAVEQLASLESRKPEEGASSP